MFKADKDNAFLECYLISLYRNGMGITELVSLLRDRFDSRMEAHIYLTRLLRRYSDGLIVQYDGYGDSDYAPSAPL